MLNKPTAISTLIICIILACATFAVFHGVIQSEFINVDDNIYVIENDHIQSGITIDGLRWAFSTTYADFWHPLTWLSLMMDYQLYGLNAGGYHLTNLILHILSTLLLFWLFCRMTGAVWKSAFVAAVFALHPLHVESVAWISERKDVLSAFFWMLTLCFYVYYTEKPVIRRYLLVFFCFALALMSKPMVVTLPVIMMLLDYWPLKRFESKKENVLLWQFKEKLPLFVLSIIFSVVTLIAQHKPPITGWPLPMESRIINSMGSLLIYLQKTFWPYDLTVCYPFLVQAPVWQLAGVVSLILIISITVILTMKKHPFLLVGWFWFFITLLPVTGIIPVGNNAMADRFLYLPSIGISIIPAWTVPLFFRNKNARNKILWPAGMTLLVFLSMVTWKQCGYWKDSITLFRHALRVNSRNYQAHINLASYHVKQGDFDDALNYYHKAIQIKPDQADAYNNRGIAYAKMSQHELALKDFNKAIRLQPDNASIYINRATFYFKQGENVSGCMDAQMACQLGNCSTWIWTQDKNLCR